jgi:hypothetical protein
VEEREITLQKFVSRSRATLFVVTWAGAVKYGGQPFLCH